jgi:ABC-type multidrug transport system ATPase subunit
VRARLGVVAHHPYIYPELTCAGNLLFFASMFDISDRERVVTAALERVGLGTRTHQRAGELSRGLLQRLNIARATLHEPAVLILDEPDTGLDASGRDVLSEVVSTHAARGGGVMFTTHSLELALSLATRVVVLRAGRVDLDQQRSAVSSLHVASLMTESPDLVGA